MQVLNSIFVCPKSNVARDFRRLYQMKKLFYFSLIVLFSCQLRKQSEPATLPQKISFVARITDSNTALKDTVAKQSVPAPKAVKSPQGIYQTILPFHGEMIQTISFSKDFTYRLQEEYKTGRKDSVVITKGNWSPSNGYIWLYENQLVRGRYFWRDDSLQYFSPFFHKNFPMHALKDAALNETLRSLKKEGMTLFGTGNKMEWSIEIDKEDSAFFTLPSWIQPEGFKIDSSVKNKDSVVYHAKNDLRGIRITVLPYFCTDGDFVYQRQISILYRDKLYGGCGIVYH